jgi:hypothetical protein
MGVLFLIIGVVLVGVGYALLTQRSTQDWWMDFTTRQRETYGWLTGIPIVWSRSRTRWSGVWTMGLGVAFLMAAFSRLT